MNESVVALAALVAALLADERERVEATTRKGVVQPRPRTPEELARVADEATAGFLAWIECQGLTGYDGLRHAVAVPEAMADLEAAVGARFLGHGVSRAVFDLGDAVLKLQWNPGEWGHSDNQYEAETWEWALQHPEARLHEVLMPVLAVAPDGWWLVMAQASPTWGASWCRSEEQSLRKTLARVEERHGMRVDDASTHNLGWHEGRLKVLDYAVFYRPIL